MKRKTEFLEQCVCDNFREAISSNFFCNHPDFMSKYNLSCAIADRLDTCIARLNKYGDYPDTEEDFIIFMVFACMITDAVRMIMRALNLNIDKTTNTNEKHVFFKDIYKDSPIYNEKYNPTDDEFFEYLRSLIFAHPFNTNRAKFLEKIEQYSPFVIANRHINLEGTKDKVGVRIYNGKNDKTSDLYISFDLIKRYINSRYKKLINVTKRVVETMDKEKAEYRKIKINRTKSDIDIFDEMINILKTRYEYEHAESLKILNAYLRCELSMKNNERFLVQYLNAIREKIPSICDAIDNMDYAELYKIYTALTHLRMKSEDYFLQKIFSYVNDYENVDNKNYGITLANEFVKRYKNICVEFIPEKMSCIEIKLLIETICFLESKNIKEDGL